jgi:hypothetical protein
VNVKYAKIGFVIAAGASFLFSVFLWFSGNHDEGLFVGLWVPSILSFGALLMAGARRDGS